MTLYIDIKADTNDADYVREVNVIDRKTLDRLRPLIVAIKNQPPKPGYAGTHNWETSDYGDGTTPYIVYAEFGEELIDIFSELVPTGEYGVHTIDEILVYERVNEEKLL